MKKKIRLLFFLIMVSFVFISCSWFQEDKNSEQTNLQNTNKTNTTEEDEKSISKDAALKAAEIYLEKMSLDEKIGQLFLIDLENLAPTGGSNQNIIKISKKMKSVMNTYPVNGVVLMSKNIRKPSQLKKLIQDLQQTSKTIPLYIATEEAGGRRSIFAGNSKLKGSVLPSYAQLSKTKTSQEVTELAKTMGNELKELGFNLNLAPIADIGDEETNISYAEDCFSTDKDVTSEMVTGMVTGLKQSGIGTVLRHFPGIGSVAGNIGQEFVDDNNGLMHMRDNEFIPFQAGINAGADMIQVSNVAVVKITQDTLPAYMSDIIIKDIIRDELKFDGIIMTDAMNVPVITSNYTPDKAVLQALSAGAEIILMPQNLEQSFHAVKQALLDRSLNYDILDEAVLHILQNKIMNGILQTEV